VRVSAKYPLAGELQERMGFRLRGNSRRNATEDEKVAKAKACSATYHDQIKRSRFGELNLLGIQKLEGDPGEPDEWMEVRQCDRCPSSISAIVATPRDNPEINASGSWEVRSADGGLEAVYVDEEYAQGYADELRRSGARGVRVEKRPARAHPAIARARGNPADHPSSVAYVQAHRARGNPASSTEDAQKQFYELLRDPDPSAMQIAQDLVLEHKLSLADLSEAMSNRNMWQPGVRARGVFWLSPFNPPDVPVTSVIWSVEAAGRRVDRAAAITSNTFRIDWRWNYLAYDHGAKDIVLPGATFRTLESARRAAAADSWAIALALKSASPSTPPSEIRDIVARAYTTTGEAPPELYEHSSARRHSKKPKASTYAEARAELIRYLIDTGWEVRQYQNGRQMATPWAESPNGQFRLWFKPQAVHYTTTSGGMVHTLGSARAISYDLDIRKESPLRFVAWLQQRFPEVTA
jgi:hypothetical protein